MLYLKTVYRLAKRSAKRFLGENTSQMGAALAYYTAFSMAPLLVIAIAMAGLIYGKEAATGQISAQISETVGPTVGKAVEAMIQSANQSSTGTAAATILGLVVLLFGASGVFGELQSSLNTIWRVPPSAQTSGFLATVRARFWSFVMVLGTGFLLLASLIAHAVLSAVSDYVSPNDTLVPVWVWQLVNVGVSFAPVTVLFAMIFKILPQTDVAWRDVWTGALVTAFLFTLGKFLLGLYLGRSSVTSAYGAAGSLAMILLWVYYSSQILLFGAVFTNVYAEWRRGQPATPATPDRLKQEPAERELATAGSRPDTL